MDGENFKWTNEYVVFFCEICIKYIRKYGRGLMKWKEIKEEFEVTAKRKIAHRSLKNKWDAMKKEWRTWKQLKREETGLGWDPSTHKISGFDEWWEKKIKENSEYKKFRNKSIDPAMDDLWSKLLEDSYANGEGCVAPTMDPQLVQPVDIEEENIESEEENRTRQGFEDLLYSQDNQHSFQLHDLEVHHGVGTEKKKEKASTLCNYNIVCHNCL
ncbi:L10-interacting MYB domain-containing protein-like isoform X1 [Ipomoea triloba]|uniref:L10-interacting MYB domain-containing protein-like isoform X1 n=1 Tax=Ipomoea triloba TaxID=35885 RepID=UPI00125E79F2|nr:L10-interacting MYB domain-containing protein-like isoform X1 [Ipomoea triloba]